MKRKNNKPSQSTISTIDPQHCVVDEYLDLNDWSTKCATRALIQRHARDLLLRAKTDSRFYKLNQYFNEHGLSGTTVKKWQELDEGFAIAYQEAKQIIGDRREIGGLEKKLDAGIVSYTMAHYDPQWKELAEWRHKLRQPEEQSGKTQIVVIEKFPESK